MTSDKTLLNTYLQKTLRHAKEVQHRVLFVVSGEKADCWSLLDELTILKNANIVANTQVSARDFLGLDSDIVIFDSFDGFDPDAFGIISGSVEGGGLMILITPFLHKWPLHEDPQNERLAVYPLSAKDIAGNYLHRLAQYLESLKLISKTAEVECRILESTETISASPNTLPNADQNEIIHGILDHAKARNGKKVVLVTADRGRGKSTALGIAAARIVCEKPQEVILVCAPHKSALQNFYKHYQQFLSSNSLTDTSGNISTNSPKEVKFVPADVLLKEKPAADLLLIDEAAALTLPVLRKLITNYNKVVLSSTLHGYEGSGRGFSLKIRELLDTHANGWQEYKLSTPVRFAENDPFESFTSKLLMLDISLKENVLSHPTAKDKLLFTIHPQHLLRDNETALASIFALLVQAHYQTRPLDLKHLLDGPNLTIATLSLEKEIVGTVLLATEQLETSDPIIEAVLHGERRPRGHLLAQQLGYQLMDTRYLNAKTARIVRIAIHPQLQNRGYGTHLVDAVTHYCQENNYDLIGASFGYATSLLSFWTQQGFHPLHIGFKRNRSSAAHSITVVKALISEFVDLTSHDHARFVASVDSRQKFYDIDTIPNALLSVQKGSSTNEADYKLAIVKSYAYRRRDFESSHIDLYNYLKTMPDHLKPRKDSLAYQKIVLNASWTDLAKNHGFTGRKQCDAALRIAIQRFIEKHSANS